MSPTRKTSSLSIRASLLAAAACVCFSTAPAQPGFPFVPGFARIALGQALLNSSRSALDAQVAAAFAAAQARAVASGAPAEPAQDSFTYVPDPRLSDWTRVSMIEALSQQDAKLRQQMEDAFADNAVLDDFDRFMSRRGYSSHDVADDLAELLLVSWQIATDRTATESQTRGVHAQTRAAFGGTPQLREMTNADRQLMGERIAYQVVLTSSAHAEYEHNGNHVQREQLQQSAAALMRAQGVDPRQVRLTDQGFRK